MHSSKYYVYDYLQNYLPLLGISLSWSSRGTKGNDTPLKEHLLAPTMSPALRSEPLEEQNHNQDQDAVSVHIRVFEGESQRLRQWRWCVKRLYGYFTLLLLLLLMLLGLSADQDDNRCLLEGRDTHVPTVLPQTIITSYSSSSHSFTTSTSHLTPTHTSTTHLEKNPFAQTEDQKGNEESGCRGHQGEEEGRKKKAEPYNPVLPRRVRDLAAFW